MRLHRLTLPSYKNLSEFTVEFAPKSSTTLIVGRNGSGKSNLIEALVRIFRDLDRGFKGRDRSDFAFDIEYEIRGRNVRIKHNPALAESGTEFWVDGDSARATYVLGRDRAFLPESVFAYYSGPSNRLEELFDRSLVEFRNAMIEGDQNVRQRLIYGRQIHSKFVLLSFFSEPDSEAVAFLRKYIGIDDIESALFILKQPYWGKKQGFSAKKQFWGARGIVQNFLHGVSSAALAPLKLDVRVASGIGRARREERVYLYIKDRAALTAAVSAIVGYDPISRARELFKTLESAYVSDLIADVRISLRKENADQTVTFRELSEGEQQLLMVLGLLRFTRDEESLFLLDEPDTHLNAAWSQQFPELVEATVGRYDRSQIIMATHDPVSISMRYRDEVRQLALGVDKAHIVASPPEEDPIKIGISGVLMSELFGLRSMLAPSMLELLERRHSLLQADDRTRGQEEELQRLNRYFDDVDLSSMIEDPAYSEFMRGSRKVDLEDIRKRPVLSAEEVREQRRITEDLLRKIAAEEP